MERPSFTPLIIHTNEWQRLKKQALPHEETIPKEESSYLKYLIDQSQAWVKTWPDTVEGHVSNVKKQKKKKYDEDVSLINLISKRIERKSSNKAVQNARQLIFEDSCYGRQLISALLESKTIEERDIQIQFKKKIKQKNLGDDQSKYSSLIPLNIEENEDEIKRRNKQRALDCVRSNKYMNEKKKETYIKEKELDKTSALEDKRFVEEILKLQEQQKREMKHAENLAAKKYKAECVKIKEVEDNQRKQDEIWTQFIQNNQNRLKCKIERVLKEIHKDKQETRLSIHVHKMIEKKHQEENSRYQFVDEAIKKQKQRELLNVKEEVEISQRELEKHRSIAAYNKCIAEKVQETKCNTDRKFICDRQSLSLVTGKNKTKNKYFCGKETDTKPQFYSPKSLLEGLKKREKIPSPWTGTKAIHEEFARQANNLLRVCQYKNPIRKVVYNYRKLNNLDDNTLPILED